MTNIDPSRYVYQPGVSQVLDADDLNIDELGLHDFSGRPITEASLAADAAEAEVTYAGLIPGGKSLSGDGSHSPRLTVIVSPATRDEVTRRAAVDNMSVSRWLRRMVERELAA